MSEQPNAYMIHRIGGVLTVMGVKTTNVKHDRPAEGAEKVLAGKVAFVAAADLRETGAAIMVGANEEAERAALALRSGFGRLMTADEALAWMKQIEQAPADAFAALRGEFGSHFDQIGDVEAWCEAARHGDDLLA